MDVNVEVDHFGKPATFLYVYLPDDNVIKIENCSKASIIYKTINFTLRQRLNT